MKNKVIPIQSDRNSCISFNDKYLVISSMKVFNEHHSILDDSQRSILAQTYNSKKIYLDRIYEVRYYDQKPEFYVGYFKERTNRKSRLYVVIKNNKLRNQFCKDLSNECNLTVKSSNFSRFHGVSLNFIKILIVLLITWGLFHVSQGSDVHNRRASVHLVKELIQYVNPYYILLTGAIPLLFFIYKIIHRILSPITYFHFKKE